MVALMLLMASGCAPSLAAPPHLVATWPVSGASLSVARHSLDLTFNRALQADATSAAVRRDDDGSTVPTAVSIDPANERRLNIRLLEPFAGSYQLHWHAVDARSGAAAEGDQAFRLVAEAPAPPRIDISPAAADVREKLTVSGKGFATSSRVELTIGDDGQPLTEAESDPQGRFRLEAAVPDSVPFGTQPIQARDAQGRVAIAAVQLKWGGWPPVVAAVAGQRGAAPGDVAFRIEVRNRSDYVVEHIRLVVPDPEGGTFVAAVPEARRESDTLVWEIPVMDRGVLGPYQARYRVTTPVVAHAWLEYRHRHSAGCTRDECMPAFISESVAASEPVAPTE